MSETLQCLDGQPNLLIPRMYFIFDESSQAFRYHIPKVDVVTAQRLKAPPQYLQTKKPRKSFGDTLSGFALKNVAGEISIEDTDAFAITSLQLNPLPQYDKVDPSVQLFWKRLEAQNKSRLPYLRDRKELFDKLVGISELQYHFGVPSKVYDPSLPPAPARFSLSNDYDHIALVTLVRPEFDEVLKTLGYEGRDRLSDAAQRYVIKHDPEVIDTERQRNRIEGMVVGQYGIYSQGGDFAYGYRGTTVDDEHSAIDGECNFRMQSGDIYRASAHNSGVLYEDIFGMLAVGMINRRALDDISPGLVN